MLPEAVLELVPGVTYGVELDAKFADTPVVDKAESPDAVVAGVVPAAALMTEPTMDKPVAGALLSIL